MNKKINAYMMAAMMAVVSPAIMGQTEIGRAHV